MHGHQWEAAEGRIVDVVSRRNEHTYTIDVRRTNGMLIRRTVKRKSPTPYSVGSTVRVEVNEHNEMQFDANPPGGDPLISSMTMADQIAEASAAFDQPGTSGPSFDTPGVFGGGSRTIHITSEVFGPGGGHLQVDPSEVSQLTQAFMSGDPAARQMAMDRIRQISDADKSGLPATDSGADAGAHQGTVEDRLARLRQLLDSGVLTQSEYETQRQRIISEL